LSAWLAAKSGYVTAELGAVVNGKAHFGRENMSMSIPVVVSDSEIMGGTPVFRGTRVPVQTLMEYLEAGESINDFLDGFPTVSREQVIAFLEEAKERVLAAV
jgi:uncharacterized protein (DUF433 family)